MLKVALTGSMAAGKSKAARNFARLGAPVFDADAAVHALYAPGGEAVRPLLALFPAAADAAGGVDRAKLSRMLQDDPGRLRDLEAIVHPLVEKMRAGFVRVAEKQGAPYAILDIPLLFETGADKAMDRIVLVTAPEHVRRARALARPGMTEEKWRLLESRQMPQEEKIARADFIIDASGPMSGNAEQVRGIHDALRAGAGIRPHQ